MKRMQVSSPEYRALVSGLLGKEVNFEEQKGLYIFRPTNESLTSIAAKYETTVELFSRIIETLKLSDNLVASKHSYNKGYLKMNSGEMFPFNLKTFELNKIKASKVVEKDSNVFISINGFPISTTQDKRIQEEVAKILLSTQKLDVLNKDTLEIILSAATAEDVANLCQTNANFRRVCSDPKVFQRLIDKHYPGTKYTDDPKKQFYFLTETAKKYDKFEPVVSNSHSTSSVRLTVQDTSRDVEGYVRKDYKNKITSNISTSSWSGTSPKVAKNLGYAYIALAEIVEMLTNSFPEIPDNLKKYMPK